MLKLCALMLLGLCFANPAQAGLFSDEDARKQIDEVRKQIEDARKQLEDARKQIQDNRKEIQQLEAQSRKHEDRINQQTRSMLDLQSQIEALNGELRKLRGQNEELVHGLGDAEKRAKDFYVDLDSRLRHFESLEEAARDESVPASGVPASGVPDVRADASDPAIENRAFEAAYGLFKEGQHANAVKAFREFLKKHPDSVHVPNATYWLGTSKHALKDYKGALGYYQKFLEISPTTPKAADVLLSIAECQKELKQSTAARKTLKQIVAQYPDSEAAAKAKKLLAAK